MGCKPSSQQMLLLLSCVSLFCVFLFLSFIIFKSSRPQHVSQASADGDDFYLHILHVSLDHTFRNITAKRYGEKVPQPIYNDVRVIPFAETLNKVHISVKSTEKYHLSRVSLLLLTWFQTVPPKNLFLITDDKDYVTGLLSDYGITVNAASECPKKHEHKALACKSGHEFEIYYQTRDRGKQYNWYCHFDDDVYVNIKALHNLLSTLNPLDKHYLGRVSTDKYPILNSTKDHFDMKRDSYHFATGAAYCISVGLMDELEQYLRGKNMEKVANVTIEADDVTVGFVIEAVLGYNMTEISTMSSHLVHLKSIKRQELSNQITISFGAGYENVISLPDGRFTKAKDSTRFLSYHCLIYPFTSWCNTH